VIDDQDLDPTGLAVDHKLDRKPARYPFGFGSGRDVELLARGRGLGQAASERGGPD
jgi:hypothetical protein